MGAGASAGEASGYYCHGCETMVDHLMDGDRCPHCEGGFVEENQNAGALAQAVNWLVSDDTSASSTEARIASLLEDLRDHLTSVEGLHGTMSLSLDIPASPKLEPAPLEVRNGITEVVMDSATVQDMRQTPHCVICCSDFEVGEDLSQLPGCSHLFHSACIDGWLDRAANCPICRCDLRQAVGLDRMDLSTASSALLETDRSQYTNSLSPSASPSGTAYRGFISAGVLGYSQSGSLWPSRSATGASPDLLGRSPSQGFSAAEGWLFADGLRPRSRAVSDREGSSPLPLSPSRRGTSSVLIGAGSSISSPTTMRRSSEVAAEMRMGRSSPSAPPP